MRDVIGVRACNRRGAALLLVCILACVAAVAPSLGRAASQPPLAPLPVRGRPARGSLAVVHFYSQAVGRVADYLVYLPREYSARRPLPVFYLLHGMPGRPLAFTVNADIEQKLEALIDRGLVAPMILVFPDGRIDGETHSDSEWANTEAGAYESYVVEVVHDVDHRFAVLRSRYDRAIAGLSAGAYGAVDVGLHQVQLFGLIQAWSGYYLQTPTGVFAHASPAQLSYDSPLDYARAIRRRLSAYPLQVFLYTGTEDADRAQTPPMAAALAAAGVDVRYAVYPGGHSWKLWTPRVDAMLIMASRFFDTGWRLVPAAAPARQYRQ